MRERRFRKDVQANCIFNLKAHIHTIKNIIFATVNRHFSKNTTHAEKLIFIG